MPLDPQMVDWINQEAAKLNRAGDAQGSRRERDMLAVWKRERPEMYKRLGKLAPRRAYVLLAKCYEARKQYIRAGMPPTDAEEQATREWCLLEPEDHATPFQLLFAPTSTSTDARFTAEPPRAESKLPPPPPERPADYGADNKTFTASMADKARARLREKLGRLNSGFDPEMMLDGLTLAGFHVEAGARTFADYSKRRSRISARACGRSWRTSIIPSASIPVSMPPGWTTAPR